MTKGYDSDKDILKILDQATAEAKALRKDAQNGISKKVMESAMDMAAKYQLIMDTAEQEITDEYRSSGTLTSHTCVVFKIFFLLFVVFFILIPLNSRRLL